MWRLTSTSPSQQLVLGLLGRLPSRLMDRFDLEKQFVFYASYHDNRVNQLLHLVCIWPILLSALLVLAGTPSLESTLGVEMVPQWLQDQYFLVPNGAAVVAMVYMLWYIALDWIAGTLGALMVFGGFVFANYFHGACPELFGVAAWQIALPVHGICWLVQFVGHGVYEKRKPALLDSLDQALITAPMFVLLEMLFPLGYRPQLYQRVSHQVQQNVKSFHARKTD